MITRSFSCSMASIRAAVVLLVLVLALIGGSDAVWCVCKSEQSIPALQKTLDYACGAGADCSPIHESGACYNPNTVLSHCSYAANSYYQRNGQTQQACDFAGTAMTTSTDPSGGSGCTYPATPSAAGTSGSTNNTSGSPTTPGSGTFTPNTGSGGVIGGGGLGPSGTTSFDGNAGGYPPAAKMGSLLLTILLPILLCLGFD